MDNVAFDDWQELGEIIERNGKNVADIITLIPKLNQFNYKTPAQTINSRLLKSWVFFMNPWIKTESCCSKT